MERAPIAGVGALSEPPGCGSGWIAGTTRQLCGYSRAGQKRQASPIAVPAPISRTCNAHARRIPLCPELKQRTSRNCAERAAAQQGLLHGGCVPRGSISEPKSDGTERPSPPDPVQLARPRKPASPWAGNRPWPRSSQCPSISSWRGARLLRFSKLTHDMAGARRHPQLGPPSTHHAP